MPTVSQNTELRVVAQIYWVSPLFESFTDINAQFLESSTVPASMLRGSRQDGTVGGSFRHAGCCCEEGDSWCKVPRILWISTCDKLNLCVKERVARSPRNFFALVEGCDISEVTVEASPILAVVFVPWRAFGQLKPGHTGL